MNIPRFWASSDPQRPFMCWHWSNESPEAARLGAEAKSRDLALRWERDEHLDRYAYGNGAIREEIVETITAEAGGAAAVITRNPYGALVLNAKSVMFIDIDFPPMARKSVLGGLFGKRAATEDREQAAIDKLCTWAATRGDLAMRVYRTFAGLRCLVTNQLFEPSDARSIALLESAGSDPLYIRLCRAQACFRARLTPKPWRSGAPVPPSRYPFSSEDQKAQYRKWQATYDRAIAGFAVCKLVREIGVRDVLPATRPVVELHDRMTRTASALPLA